MMAPMRFNKHGVGCGAVARIDTLASLILRRIVAGWKDVRVNFFQTLNFANHEMASNS